MRTIYRKTKRGSIIKLKDYSTEEPIVKDDKPVEKFLYPKHLSQEELTCIKKSGLAIFEGYFQTSRENLLEGHVSITLKGEDVHVLIQGLECINRAIHDDYVAIELLPETEWKTRSELVFLPEQSADEENFDNFVDRKPASILQKPILTAKVVSIIKRSWRQYPGVLRRKKDALSSTIRCLFIPTDRRIPVIRIETRQYATLKNQRLVVQVDNWPRSSKFPQGHYVKALGVIGNEDAEKETILLEHDIPHLDFTPDVLSCLPPENWTIPQDEFSKRTDLRNEAIVSVDPPGCTDIDDALHFKDLDSKFCQVGVHIADVSYFVKPETPLDCEASNRGTSVYLADRRIDMIPAVLSSNLCSLIEQQDRLAFSVIWTINKEDASIVNTIFKRSVINSKRSLTYQQAQEIIDDAKNKRLIATSLRGLMRLSKILKKNRISKGALCLARADEIKFVELEPETPELGPGIEITQKKLLDTNSMVEEFMLLANISVACQLVEHFPDIALLRRHPKPSSVNFEDLTNSAKAKGFYIETSDGKSLSQTLDKAKSKDEYFNLMLRMIATRCMTPASYFCSGCLDTQALTFSHFGLAADLYTHFTSPIRRYADLLVHRLLSCSIGCGSLDNKIRNKDNLQAVCDKINYRHRMAQYASRASNKLHTILYIKSKRQIATDAYVFFVRQNAVQILIPELAYEHTYFLQPLSDWTFDVTKRCQLHKLGIKLKQFDKIKVHISLSPSESVRFSEKIKVLITNPGIDTVKKTKNLQELMEIEPQESIETTDKVKNSRLLPEDSAMDVETPPLKKAKFQLAAIKRKIRMKHALKGENNKPVIVIPGDNLTKYISFKACSFGPGLNKCETEVLSTKPGLFKSHNNSLYWIDTNQRRYVASKADYVIGIIKSKASLHCRVDIGTPNYAMLSLLAFENATKSNKPFVNVGDLVYCRVLAASKHIEAELVCVSTHGRSDGLGVIASKCGRLLTVSLETIRALLNPDCQFLKKLGQMYKYEIALGMNGRVWINAHETDVVLRLANEIRKFDLS